MKKLLLTLFIFTFYLSPIFSQGKWTPRDTLPDSAMFQGISGFSINGYGYAGLGNNVAGEVENYFWQFDPATNSWTKKKPFPGKGRIAPASFVIGNYAYIVCGSVRNGGACVNECWQYDAMTNTWAQKANFPGAVRTYAVGFAIDSLGYVGTGANELSDFYKDFYAYHPSTNTWTKIADFGGIARSGASGFSVNGKGYICFGQDSTIKYYGDMWEYTPGTNSWSRKANIPGDSLTPHFLASGFVICNNIYVGSGVDSAYKWSHEFWKYNTVTNTWTQEASVPGPTKVEGAAFSIGDTGYYGFGWDSTGFQIINAFYKFYAGDSCNSDAGINTVANISDINIYPNPFKDECFIKMPDNYTGNALFSLYDMQGTKIEMAKLPIGPDNTYILKRNGLKNGVYVLTIKYNDQIFYKKLIMIN